MIKTINDVEKTFIKNMETFLKEQEKENSNVSLMDLAEDISFDANYIASVRKEFIGSTPRIMFEKLKAEKGH